jgi:hypothetical protein
MRNYKPSNGYDQFARLSHHKRLVMIISFSENILTIKLIQHMSSKTSVQLQRECWKLKHINRAMIYPLMDGEMPEV